MCGKGLSKSSIDVVDSFNRKTLEVGEAPKYIAGFVLGLH